MPNPLTQQNRLVARRAKTMERSLTRWMLRRAREQAAEKIKALRRKADGGWTTIAKREPLLVASRRLNDARNYLNEIDSWGDDPTGEARKIATAAVSKSKRDYERVLKADPIDQELLDILMRFGIAQSEDAALRIGYESGVKRLVDSQQLKRALASKEFKLKIFTEAKKWATSRARHISADTRGMVTDSIMRVLTDAASEVPMPSTGEIARRIRTQFHGTDPKGRVFAFSPERAALIARTELAQATNTGTFNGYKAAGVKKIRWLAKRDGRSGDRHHERMHGEEIELGERFTLPDGTRMRHPGDPSAPIKHTANCRCAVRAVIV